MGNPCKNGSQSLRIMVREDEASWRCRLRTCHLAVSFQPYREAGILDLDSENLAMMINYFILFYLFRVMMREF